MEKPVCVLVRECEGVCVSVQLHACAKEIERLVGGKCDSQRSITISGRMQVVQSVIYSDSMLNVALSQISNRYIGTWHLAVSITNKHSEAQFIRFIYVFSHFRLVNHLYTFMGRLKTHTHVYKLSSSNKNLKQYLTYTTRRIRIC